MRICGCIITVDFQVRSPDYIDTFLLRFDVPDGGADGSMVDVSRDASMVKRDDLDRGPS